MSYLLQSLFLTGSIIMQGIIVSVYFSGVISLWCYKTHLWETYIYNVLIKIGLGSKWENSHSPYTVVSNTFDGSCLFISLG